MFTNIFSSKKRKIGVTNGSVYSVRIGEHVHSPTYGNGVVRAIHPNGTLLVRFEGQQKSHSVFPTFISRSVH